MCEPQGCHRKEQTIRLLTVPNNVTLNSIAERGTDREKKRRKEKAWGRCVYTDQRGLETLDAEVRAGRE